MPRRRRPPSTRPGPRRLQVKAGSSPRAPACGVSVFCVSAVSRRRRRRQREKAPRRVATRHAHRRRALTAEALRVRARRDERSRRQRQDKCGNAHRCNLSFTLAAPRRRRAVAPVLLLSCQSAAAQADLGGRPRASVRVVTEESVATRETDGRGALGARWLGDARVRARRRAVSIVSRRLRATGAGDGRQDYGRMKVPRCLGGRGLGVPRGGRRLSRRAVWVRG